MVNLKVNKLRMIAAASVVVFALASAPASANHGHDIVGPAVAFIALSALFHHGHQGHHGHHGQVVITATISRTTINIIAGTATAMVATIIKDVNITTTSNRR